MTLLLAAESFGNFAQQFVLLLPAGLERPPKAFGVENGRRRPQSCEEK